MLEPIAFLSIGLLIPVFNWVGLVLAWGMRLFTGKDCTPVMFPIIGPALMTYGILMSGSSAWLILLAWVIDPATLFCVYTILEMCWKVSRWTRIATLFGEQGDHSVEIFLHSSGIYFLEQHWKSPIGLQDVTHLSEDRSYTCEGENYELMSYRILFRTLRKNADGSFDVIENSEINPDAVQFPLHGWTLRRIA